MNYTRYTKKTDSKHSVITACSRYI